MGAKAARGTRGKFVTFEGGEGAGKSTQVLRLIAALKRSGHKAIATREPGGAPGAELIRGLLVEGPPERWDPLAEALLHNAARRQHAVLTIWPALERGDWVVSDRFADSTLAYQGYGLGLDRGTIDALRRITLNDFEPDLTVILDLPVSAGLARAKAREAGKASRYELMSEAVHERLRKGFLDIARSNPKRCVVIDASANVDSVAEQVRRSVHDRLGVDLNG